MTQNAGHDDRPEPTVAVRGDYRTEVEPEYARLVATVSSAGADRDRVLTQLARRVAEIRHLVEGYGEAVERIEGHPLRAGPQFKNGKPTEKVTGYTASTALGVVVVDFTVLGDLVLRLADADMVAVTGPSWALRPDSSAFARARTEAVREARLRAEQYAAAIGAELTGLLEIADAGLSGDRPEAAAVPLAAHRSRRSRASSVADEVEIDLTPVPLEVSATVQARFTISRPDLSTTVR